MTSPADLLEILSNHVVLASFVPYVQFADIPQRLALRHEDTQAEKREGGICSVFSLGPPRAGTDDPQFDSYVCNYREGRTHQVTLGRVADFCCTMSMNGCTWGVGTPVADGTVIATHSNARGAGTLLTPEQQAGAQRAATHDILGPAADLLEPADYRAGGAIVTMVGLWLENEWQFHYQRYTREGGGTHYTLLNCNRMTTRNMDF